MVSFSSLIESLWLFLIESPWLSNIGGERLLNTARWFLSISDEAPFVSYNLNISDIPSLKNAIKKTTKLLFASGAKKVFLPIRDTKPINDPGSSLEKTIDNLNPRKLEIVSVHAMASCSMGGEPESITDLNGKVNGLKNIHVTDASVLPSNIGESPQGTIMAIARRNIHNFLDL